MTKKMCEICGDNPATIPDRERMGRPINRICRSCHALRLSGDIERIIELRKRSIVNDADSNNQKGEEDYS